MVDTALGSEVSDWYLTETARLRRVLLVRKHELTIKEGSLDIIASLVEGLARAILQEVVEQVARRLVRITVRTASRTPTAVE